MGRRARGWSDLSTEEKLEVLRTDVSSTLDIADNLKRKTPDLEQSIILLHERVQLLSAHVFELGKKAGMKWASARRSSPDKRRKTIPR